MVENNVELIKMSHGYGDERSSSVLAYVGSVSSVPGLG